MDKYDKTKFSLFLLIDGEEIGSNDKDERDSEEIDMGLTFERGVSPKELKARVRDGKINLVGVAAIELACAELKRMGLLDDW